MNGQRHFNDGEAENLIPKIQVILSFIRNYKCEVPFIAQYRKDYYSPELQDDELWKIYNFDEKVMVDL
jgi:transcription elongation factor SPT6